MTTYRFTKSELEHLTEPAAAVAVLNAPRSFTVSREVSDAASARLAAEAEEMSFATGKPLRECLQRVIAKHPNLMKLRHADIAARADVVGAA